MQSDPDPDASDVSEFESQSASYSELSGSEAEEEGSWVEWFCNLKGNEFFVEVDEEYIQDDFNLTGLSTILPYFDHALNMILDLELTDDSPDPLTEEQYPIVEGAAQMLYGLIHARYILTSKGLQAISEKYQERLYGQCPNVMCDSQSMLPVGLSDVIKQSTTKTYCPRCQELYHPTSNRLSTIDGAFFGTTMAPLYFMTYPEVLIQTHTHSHTFIHVFTRTYYICYII
eukprot:GHVR01175305.1.p1 GENE.GHVR01175305.1~~GHVR01175305.1.p1  ORF type:complete len:229 (+),score=26.95 GHVR01175305.1:80-766(+)